MTTKILTNNLGYPRIGDRRELKKSTEAYWAGKMDRDTLLGAAAELRRRNWEKQRDAGIDLIPSNDFSFYDQVLDMSLLLGNVPKRFAELDEAQTDLDRLFSIARGHRSHQNCPGCAASEMTKWFDTNYHYIVPELSADSEFQLNGSKVIDEFNEALALGILTKPVLVGPLTWLKLGKCIDREEKRFDRLDLLERLLPVYVELVRKLASFGAKWIQFDEPALALDLTNAEREALNRIYCELSNAAPAVNLMVATYFGELRDNLDTFAQLPVTALHFDAVRGRREIEALITALPDEKILSLGVVDGRNIWKNRYSDSLELLKAARAALGEKRVMVAASCSLMHSPVSLDHEPDLDPELHDWLAFADQKLVEISELRDLLIWRSSLDALHRNEASQSARARSQRIHHGEIQQRAAAVTAADLTRPSAYPQRRRAQRERLKLPLFPTTTIGSFPQTREVRRARARFRKGELSPGEYRDFLREETARCIQEQEILGLDMPVHGEFERTDMVEYFGEQLNGFAFTRNGWVQSYGTRCVKPPVIFGDVSRTRPMTVEWSAYAQSLTERPMKGMLTGPITILQWSFVRDDQPRSETARQIALAIRDEVSDLEAAGLPAIQIDEPALREGLPLRKDEWAAYLDWSVDAFRLASSVAADATQIHTHMCYCEFNDIIDAIARLDADVITIETSRSNMELLEAFTDFAYPNEIGPGVYDIHSPRVPSVDEMQTLLEKAAAVLPIENLWANPDCGLKTRAWPETRAALENLVAAAKAMRTRYAESESLSIT